MGLKILKQKYACGSSFVMYLVSHQAVLSAEISREQMNAEAENLLK